MIKNKLSILVNKIKSLSKRQRIFSIIGIIVLFFILSSIGGEDKTEVVLVTRGTVEEEVLVTGKTKSRTEVNLGFEASGRIVFSNVEVGSKVYEGQTLVELDQSDLLAKLRKADANLNQALVELESTKRTSVVSNQTAEDALLLNLKDAYIKSDNAVRNSIDQFFTNPVGQTRKFNPSIIVDGFTYYGDINESVKKDITADRQMIEKLLSEWELAQASLNKQSDLEEGFMLAQNNLNQVQVFVEKVANAINSFSYKDQNYNVIRNNDTIESYKATMSVTRTSLTTVGTNMLAAKDKYNSAPQEVGMGKSLDLVLIEEAKIESLRADKALIEADLRKTVLRSPINGLVTKMDAKKGEIVTTGGSLVGIISDELLQIEAFVSEVNIGKVRVGNRVSVEFDAIKDTEYSGKVVYVDPASTLVDGVPTYKVTVIFDNSDTSKDLSVIRSGLTANLKIETKKIEDVLKIPEYALEKRSDGNFVLVLSDSGEEEREVEVGLRGKDGQIEVISGLSVDEKIKVSASN
ncbi:MAG: HlyD family secretion protein [Parcubacteria bacterium C7867-005]|nr:MAG: HlyD family secretion protein [Parcubacteria bacterium C7867-005]